MWLFSKKKVIEQEVNAPPLGEKFEFIGRAIWDLIADGFYYRGYDMVRGTGRFGTEWAADGKVWALSGYVVARKPSNIVIMVDGKPFPNTVWNKMRTAEREHMVQTHEITLKYVDYNDPVLDYYPFEIKDSQEEK